MKLILLFFTFICFASAKAQLIAVERYTGRVIPCDEFGCTDDDTTYQTTDRQCLNCFYRVSDSTIQSINSAIIQKLTITGKKPSVFIKKQKSWESKRQKEASKVGDQYKGGTMEMTEYVRTKLIMTNKRIVYLKSYLLKL